MLIYKKQYFCSKNIAIKIQKFYKSSFIFFDTVHLHGYQKLLHATLPTFKRPHLKVRADLLQSTLYDADGTAKGRQQGPYARIYAFFPHTSLDEI
jgi:hypothetical protein